MRAHGERRREAPTGRGCPVWAFLCAGCLLGIGCAGTGGVANDPLFGRSAGVAADPPSKVTAGPNAVPPMPAPGAAGSTAALASGLGGSLDGRHGLQIDDPRPPGVNQTWAGPAAEPGAVLQRPQPVPGPAAPAPSSLTSAPPVQTLEQAQARLTARGVVWQRLEALPEPGRWKFSCSVPNPRNPQIHRVFEAQAASGLDAIRAVLDQLDREKF